MRYEDWYVGPTLSKWNVAHSEVGDVEASNPRRIQIHSALLEKSIF
jgi:hypothetical protein